MITQIAKFPNNSRKKKRNEEKSSLLSVYNQLGHPQNNKLFPMGRPTGSISCENFFVHVSNFFFFPPCTL